MEWEGEGPGEGGGEDEEGFRLRKWTGTACIVSIYGPCQ